MTALPQTVLQDIKKSSEHVHWNVKNYWILYASLWNSTTVTTLIHIYFGRFLYQRIKLCILGEKYWIVLSTDEEEFFSLLWVKTSQDKIDSKMWNKICWAGVFHQSANVNSRPEHCSKANMYVVRLYFKDPYQKLIVQQPSLYVRMSSVVEFHGTGMIRLRLLAAGRSPQQL